MVKRTKILVVDSDLDSLSRIYLALAHRNYKTEVSDRQEEIRERSRRLKPVVIILGKKEYLSEKDNLKVPVIVLVDRDDNREFHLGDDCRLLEKPVKLDQLFRTMDELVI
jgi:DNA-binding response OmpR family regulator